VPTFSKDCLREKRILITGGPGAIGRVVVKRLLEVSSTVAVNDVVETDKAAEVIREAGWPADRCPYFKADVTKSDEARELIEGRGGDGSPGYSDLPCGHVAKLSHS
jgi:NAD(P)-dependent dehydrogenase (short-subunit alcohol dehydrogenase family)